MRERGAAPASRRGRGGARAALPSLGHHGGTRSRYAGSCAATGGRGGAQRRRWGTRQRWLDSADCCLQRLAQRRVASARRSPRRAVAARFPRADRRRQWTRRCGRGEGVGRRRLAHPCPHATSGCSMQSSHGRRTCRCRRPRAAARRARRRDCAQFAEAPGARRAGGKVRVPLGRRSHRSIERQRRRGAALSTARATSVVRLARACRPHMTRSRCASCACGPPPAAVRGAGGGGRSA